ncbi:aminotransferase class I/II-fold pyridoxal phosphate-dependent enzyme, partial [Enterobacter hormaechei]|uniref:aminotransferase class I/II-fold pyridoxal phosphate-dependent enzyme n=1 Tax=Enterobacter hormaechei TaxID=158836 RepID=UPI00197F1C11
NQYAPMAGLPVLREAIAEKVQGLYGAAFDPDTEITVTAGATQALFTAIAALVHPGDEVIVFAPGYDSYAPSVGLRGGKVVYATLQQPEWRPDCGD